MKKTLQLAVLLFLTFTLVTAHAQGTAFTYQGRLNSGGAVANGSYDISFSLFATNVNGVAIVGPVTNSAIAVTNGLFTTLVDFGNVFTGASNWLQVAVSTNGANNFATLAPRQQLTPVPYAIVAANVSGTVPLAQLPAVLVTNGASGVNLSGAFSGVGSGLTNVPGTIPWQTVAGSSQTAAANQGLVLTNNLFDTVTLPTSANIGDIVAVAGVGSNGWQVAVGGNQTLNGYVQPAGLIWTPQNSGVSNYQVVASSADGVKLVAGAYSGKLYTSSDSGSNWTARTTGTTTNWQAVASSADGVKLVALGTVSSITKIYTSADSGVTWVFQAGGPPSALLTSVASSSDGTKLVIARSSGAIYTSGDSGVTWTPQSSGSALWKYVASSADGTKLVAVARFASISTSTDSGVTWTAQPGSLANDWASVASSADGTKLVASVSSGAIYTSTNSGTNWTAQNTLSAVWNFVASSADGTKLVASAVGGQKIYTSTDSGVTWGGHDSNRDWFGIASSADGNKLVATALNQPIYTSTSFVSPFIGTPGTSAQFQYLGNGVWQPVTESFSQVSGTLPVSQLPGTVVTNNASGVTLTGTFTGNGGGLTNLTLLASNLTGTIADARLSTNVALLTANQTFTGQNIFTNNSVSGAVVQLNGSTNQDRLRLVGTEFYQGNTDTNGVSLLLGVNRSNNRQLWFVDSAATLSRNNTNTLIRMLLGGTNAAIDSYATDGNTPRQLVINGNGGNVGIGKYNPATSLDVAGTITCISLNQTSDRNAKENFTAVDVRDVLAKVVALPVTEWNYKADSKDVQHLGPMAQDFKTAFNLDGADDRHISVIDEGGVALAAIQGLNEKLEARSQALQKENAELKARLEKLEQLANLKTGEAK